MGRPIDSAEHPEVRQRANFALELLYCILSVDVTEAASLNSRGSVLGKRGTRVTTHNVLASSLDFKVRFGTLMNSLNVASEPLQLLV